MSTSGITSRSSGTHLSRKESRAGTSFGVFSHFRNDAEDKAGHHAPDEQRSDWNDREAREQDGQCRGGNEGVDAADAHDGAHRQTRAVAALQHLGQQQTTEHHRRRDRGA